MSQNSPDSEKGSWEINQPWLTRVINS